MEQVHQRIEDEAIDQHRKASLRHRQNRDAEEPIEYMKRLRSDENADGPPSPMRQQGSKTPRPTTFETLAAESLQGMKRTMSSTSLALSFMSPESLDEFKHSTAADVWMYGILVWQTFYLGEEPYHDIETPGEIMAWLKVSPSLGAFCDLAPPFLFHPFGISHCPIP